jgi:hypothetical protein
MNAKSLSTSAFLLHNQPLNSCLQIQCLGSPSMSLYESSSLSHTHNLGLSQEISNHCNTSGGGDAEICKEEEAARHSNAH